jgi:hypothetical protein
LIAVEDGGSGGLSLANIKPCMLYNKRSSST